jgi:hypothetical protein
VFNPDIAVIGDFLGAAGHNSVNPSPAFAMHESEASFQAIVDPYARADFFLSFGEEGVDLEEGFVTFPTVPGGLLVRAGKVRAAFGKVNALHNHVLPWADRPLVTENLVGGEEGISDAGLSVARLVPNPWFFLEATGQVFAETRVICSTRASPATYRTSPTCADITTSRRTPISISARRTRVATMRRVCSPGWTWGSSRPSSMASTPRCGGVRSSDPFTARSSADRS